MKLVHKKDLTSEKRMLSSGDKHYLITGAVSHLVQLECRRTSLGIQISFKTKMDASGRIFTQLDMLKNENKNKHYFTSI